MGMLQSYTVYKAVVDGEEMKVHLTEVTERPNPNYGKEGEKSKDLQGYIDFEWTRADGRPMRDSRSFPQGVNILVEQLLAQHPELPTCIRLDELVALIRDNKTEFSCWAYSNYQDGVVYRNYGFRKPEAQPAVQVQRQVSKGIEEQLPFA